MGFSSARGGWGWVLARTQSLTEKGVVKSKRSVWRLSIITDFLWAIVNLIGVFLQQCSRYLQERLKVRQEMGWGGPGGPGNGPYGGGPRGPPRGLNNVRGIDHSKLLALFLRVVPAVEVEGLNASLLLEQVRANLRGV
ncbi:hypothetical protein RJ639_040839 [Escallonia herrerae]|uniref:Selenoprotein K n=1 Tax=Escallonia herrerae TaxID=1293975 RepID=A0AA88WEG4_9ASTE|nr:hypothetical protein RJ639_040839 [Escallonia herrerae]